MADSSYTPTDNTPAGFSIPTTKGKGTRPKITIRASSIKTSRPKFSSTKTTVRMPKSGGLRGFATAKRLGAKAMSVRGPKASTRSAGSVRNISG